jgi:hypothetical protein
MSRSLTAIALLLVGFVLPASAAPRAAEKLVSVSYSVADLVVPINDCPAIDLTKTNTDTPPCRPPSPTTSEERLIRAITHHIRPKSWTDRGGQGTIQYFPLGMSLVIKQTASVHKEIAAFFAALRRQQDVEVMIAVRFVQLGDSIFERWCRALGRDRAASQEFVTSGGNAAARWDALARWETSRSLLLTDREVRRLLESAQANRKASIVQTPKLTMFNGQRAALYVCGETGEDVAVEFQPSVAEDRGSVALHIKCRYKGATLHSTLSIPDGTSALLGNWNKTGAQPREQVLMLVTPRVVISGEKEEFIGWKSFVDGDYRPQPTPVRVHGGIGP